MKKNLCWARVLIGAAMIAILAGCASNPAAGTQAGSSTNSDQTDNQKRAHIRLQLAVGYFQQHQMEVALDEVGKALKAEPDFPDAYSMRALIYMDMKENKRAEADFRQALKLSPNNPDFSNNYGWFLCQTDRERESIRYFEAAFNDHSYESPAKAFNNAGVCSLRLKDEVAAQKYFLQAFERNPSNPSTNINLARLYYKHRDYERAHFYTNRLVKADVMTAEVLWLAIRIEHKLGDRGAEMGYATQLRRRYPASAEYAAYGRGAFDE